MGIPFTLPMGFLFTATMGKPFTMTLGIQLTISIPDWYSRYILAWELSVTLDKEFCLEAVRRELLVTGPEIFNTDQGPQFTSGEFTSGRPRRSILEARLQESLA